MGMGLRLAAFGRRSSANIQRVDPGFFLGGDAPLGNNVTGIFLQNTSSMRKPHVISGGQNPCTLPLDLPRSYYSVVRMLFLRGGGLCAATLSRV